MQQYGLAEAKGKFAPAGKYSPVHLWKQNVDGAVLLRKGTDRAIQEAAIKRCGDGWILALMTQEGGNVCATVDNKGNIKEWESIEKSVGMLPVQHRKSPYGGRMGRIAPLGSREATSCGSDSRFLFGYEKADHTRWLVEVDGNCRAKESTRQEVTDFTTWPLYQDWATTAGGAVVWVTSWITNPPSSVVVYSAKGGAKDGYLFDITPRATNAAQLSVYYP